MLEEEARQAKLAAGRSNPGLSSQERERIDKIVEEVKDILLLDLQYAMNEAFFEISNFR